MSKHAIAIEPQAWLDQLKKARGEKEVHLPQIAIQLYAPAQQDQLNKGLGIATILLELGLDTEGVAASILYPAFQHHDIHLDTVAEQFGENTAKLLRDVLQMGALSKLQHLEKRASHQLENLRKMLLAMVADVRAVLITLAERLWLLRHANQLSSNEQQALAHETLSIYAPLANRLGVGQLKWEMEDLCLRYLKADIYKDIAKSLDSKRTEREKYIEHVMQLLRDAVKKTGIHEFEVTGRVKHIYSIYRKMQRKKVDFSELYDISAVRVLVPTIEDCYAVLGLVHGQWQQIPKEFDDYVTHPKPNGYRSIHTAVIGPEHKNVEVQIRTYQMHQESELGVAAHWRYKEGGQQASSYEAKIAWLRQIMEWQKEIALGEENQTQQLPPQQDLFADRVYVFTPTGDIVDLPQGATPLDFAYHVHSEVGHRCRGAKINGNIVPLTYELNTGDRVEILTTKQSNPSRDWLNPHLGYLKSPRARAKVQHWFKALDYAENVTNGRHLLEKELKRLHLPADISLQEIAEKQKFNQIDDMLASLGSGELRIAQILHQLQPPEEIDIAAAIIARGAEAKKKSKTTKDDIQIVGVGSLLTQMAKCCKPAPGDSIIGYITQGKGVSIHRRDCSNMLHVTERGKQRLLEVEWGSKVSSLYSVDLYVKAYDRHGLLRDITTLFAAEKINLLSINTQTDKHSHEAHIDLTVEIPGMALLGKVLDRLQHLPNVLMAERKG